jgi:hypothetical protein
VKGGAIHHATKGLAALAVASLALSAVACNKGPAQEALEEAERALAAARPDLEKYLPEELAELTAAAQDARSRLDEGRYTDALKVAQELPLKIQLAVGAATVAKSELVARWKEMSATVPGLVQAIDAKVAELAVANKLPKGTAAFQEGDVPRAVRTAQDIKAKAEALAGMLGIAAAPAPAE